MFKLAAIAAVALFSQEAQAINTVQRLKMREQIDAAIDEYLSADESAEAEWGFLKNIVNIDRFFDSGVQAWAQQQSSMLWQLKATKITSNADWKPGETNVNVHVDDRRLSVQGNERTLSQVSGQCANKYYLSI